MYSRHTYILDQPLAVAQDLRAGQMLQHGLCSVSNSMLDLIPDLLEFIQGGTEHRGEERLITSDMSCVKCLGSGTACNPTTSASRSILATYP